MKRMIVIIVLFSLYTPLCGMRDGLLDQKVLGNQSKREIEIQVERARLRLIRYGLTKMRLEKELQSTTISDMEKLLLTCKAKEAELKQEEAQLIYATLSGHSKQCDEIIQAIKDFYLIGESEDDSYEECSSEDKDPPNYADYVSIPLEGPESEQEIFPS